MKIKTLVAFVLISLLLISCSTLSSRVQSAVSGFPLWYYEPSVGLEDYEKSFVAVGQASSERQAELLAYSDLSQTLAQYFGHEISPEDYRELVTLGTINTYAMKMEDKSSMLKNGNYIVLLRVKSDYDYLQTFRTRAAIERETKAQRIKDLILEGDSFIMNNEDLKGVSCYLKSMVLSYGFEGLEEQYSFNAIKNEVLDILKTTSLTVENKNPSKVSATISVRRKESIIASAVQDCKVKAQYISIDGRGNEYTDFFEYSTDHNGRFVFKVFNNAIPKKGSIVFSIDLDEDIKALYEKDSSVASMIEGMVISKSVSLDYDREYSMGKIGVSVLEYDIDANYRSTNRFSEKLCSFVSSDGIECCVVRNNSDVTDEVLTNRAFSDAYEAGCLVVLRAGANKSLVSSTGVCSVVLEGKMTFYDKSSKIIYESEIISANGFGSDFADAEDNAFENMCRIVYTLLKAIYV